MPISVPCFWPAAAFVDIAFGIGLHAGPVLGVDQLDDQAAERGGVLDILRAISQFIVAFCQFLFCFAGFSRKVHKHNKFVV